MKKSKLSIIICAILVLVFVVMSFAGCSGTKRSVDKEYEYNTEIITNENAPVEGDADVTAITGFVEDNEQKLLTLPYTIPDTGLVVTAVGKYTGPYIESGVNEEAENALAIVIKNTTDKVVSYSSIEVQLNDKEVRTFSPTNLPPNQSTLSFPINKVISYDDVKQFTVNDTLVVPTDSLPLLEGKVGVDFKDGEFIITNLTNENLGDVYVRYKNFSEGNVYLGGITYSVVVNEMTAYETKKVAAESYSEENSIIISVESIIPLT